MKLKGSILKTGLEGGNGEKKKVQNATVYKPISFKLQLYATQKLLIIIGENRIQTESLILDSFIPTKVLAPHYLGQSFLSPFITWLTSTYPTMILVQTSLSQEVLSDHIVSYHNIVRPLSRVILHIFV